MENPLDTLKKLLHNIFRNEYQKGNYMIIQTLFLRTDVSGVSIPE